MTTPLGTVRKLSSRGSPPSPSASLKSAALAVRTGAVLARSSNLRTKASPTHSKLTQRCKQELFKLQMRAEKLQRKLPKNTKQAKNEKMLAPIKLGDSDIERVLQNAASPSKVLEHWGFVSQDEAITSLSLRLELDHIIACKIREVERLCLQYSAVGIPKGTVTRATGSGERTEGELSIPLRNCTGSDYVASILTLTDRIAYLVRELRQAQRKQETKESSSAYSAALEVSNMKEKLKKTLEALEKEKNNSDTLQEKVKALEKRCKDNQENYIRQSDIAKLKAIEAAQAQQLQLNMRTEALESTKKALQKIRLVAEESERSGMEAREALRKEKGKCSQLEDKIKLMEEKSKLESETKSKEDVSFVAEMQEKMLQMRKSYEVLKRQLESELESRETELSLLQKQLASAHERADRVNSEHKKTLSDRDARISQLFQELSDAEIAAETKSQLAKKNELETLCAAETAARAAEQEMARALDEERKLNAILREQCRKVAEEAQSRCDSAERRVALMSASQAEEIQRLRFVIGKAETAATAQRTEMQMMIKALSNARDEQAALQARVDKLIDAARTRDETGEYTDTFEEVMQEEFRNMRTAMQQRLDEAANQLRKAMQDRRREAESMVQKHAIALSTERAEAMKWQTTCQSLREQIANLQKNART